MDDVIPILHGERTFAPHHYGHGDVVVGTIDICVPNAVAKIEVLTAFALVNVLTDLRWAFHVQDEGLSLIVFYHVSFISSSILHDTSNSLHRQYFLSY